MWPTAARSGVCTSWIAFCGSPASLRPRTHGVGDNARRVQALGAAAQDNGVCGSQAEGASIGRHVGAAFIDDANDADGHADAREGEAAGPLPGVEHRANRIVKGGDIGDALRHRLDAGGRGFQTVEHRAREALGAAALHVEHIGGDDLRRCGADARRHGGERSCAFRRPGLGDGGGSGARAHAHGEHGSGESGVVCGEGQLDRHGRCCSRRGL